MTTCNLAKISRNSLPSHHCRSFFLMIILCPFSLFFFLPSLLGFFLGLMYNVLNEAWECFEVMRACVLRNQNPRHPRRNNIISPCGSVPWPWNMSIYCVGPEQSKNICLLIINSSWLLEIWVELYARHYSHKSLFILALFARNIVHPGIIHWKYQH